MSKKIEFTEEQMAELLELGTPVMVKSMVRTVVGECESEGLPLDASTVVAGVREKLSHIKIGKQISDEEKREILIREFQQMVEQSGEANERDGMETTREVTVIKTNSAGERYEAKMDVVAADLTIDSDVVIDGEALLAGSPTECPHCHGHDVLTVNTYEAYCNSCDQSYHASSDVAMEDMLGNVLKRDLDLSKRLAEIRAKNMVKKIVEP